MGREGVLIAVLINWVLCPLRFLVQETLPATIYQIILPPGSSTLLSRTDIKGIWLVERNKNTLILIFSKCYICRIHFTQENAKAQSGKSNLQNSRALIQSLAIKHKDSTRWLGVFKLLISPPQALNTKYCLSNLKHNFVALLQPHLMFSTWDRKQLP